MPEEFRRSTYINAWHVGEHESAAPELPPTEDLPIDTLRNIHLGRGEPGPPNHILNWSLVFTTSNMPRILGVFLMVAAVGYQIDSFGNFVSSAYGANPTNFVIFVAIPAALSEIWLTLWLLLKGGGR